MKSSENKIRSYSILLVVVLILVVRLICSFVLFKENMHSDEIWSFGLSNSYYEPFIYQNATHDELINFNKWLPSQVLRDYLTVTENHRFSYDSVYYNQVHDYHPPLYYYILHTICSFFPGSFSLWYGFVINIFALVGTVLFLYKFVCEATKNSSLALITCVFYGISIGSLNTFIFIRMYALLTMIAIILLYIHARIYYTQSLKKYSIVLFVVTVSGALTHHFFVPYAGFLAVCYFVYFLFRKKYKILVGYSCIMLLAVGTSLLLFPETIGHVFSGRINDPKYTYSWQLILTINCMFKELLGIEIPLICPFSIPAVCIVVLCLTIIFLPLILLLRKEIWFRKAILFFKNIIYKIFKSVKKTDLVLWSALIVSFGTIILTSLTVSLISMGDLTDRYLFLAYPGFCGVAVCIIYGIIRLVLKKKKVCIMITAIICCVISVYTNKYDCNYYFPRQEGTLIIQEKLRGSNCVFATGEHWLLTCFSNEGLLSENFYAIDLDKSESFENKIENMPNAPNKDAITYYCVDNNVFNDETKTEILVKVMPSNTMSTHRIEKMERKYFENLLINKYSKAEYVGVGIIFGREYSLYRVN